MSVTYFGSKSSSSGGSPYPKLVTTPLPYATYRLGGSTSFVNQATSLFYAYRSAAGNRGLRINSDVSVSLIQVNMDGTNTVVASFNPQSYLTNSQSIQPQQICYSTVDQCWYILLAYVNPDHLRLIKVNDTTGAVTAIGASFNPANPTTAWPSATTGSDLMSFYLDNVTGHLKVICNGVYHLLNKTTGAIVSQDTPLVLTGGVYNLSGCAYLTQDNTVGCGYVFPAGSYSDSVTFTRLFGNNGNMGFTVYPSNLFSFDPKMLSRLNYVDHDKIIVGYFGSGGTSGSIKVVTVAEYDAFLTALYKYETEV